MRSLLAVAAVACLLGGATLLGLSPCETSAVAAGPAPRASGAPGQPPVTPEKCAERCEKRFAHCNDHAKDLHEEGECAWERQECRGRCGTATDAGDG